MKLAKHKKIFFLSSCIVLLGFAWIQNVMETESMQPWSSALDDQLVTPVSTVALFQSKERLATRIEYDEIQSLVNQAIAAAGGLESIVSDGDSIILKPNLVGSGGSHPFVNGVTTDYRVVRAVSELVRQLNPTGWIGVLEGSAPGNRQGTRDMFELYGYNKTNLPEVDDIIALEDVDGEDKNYNSPQLVSVSLPDSISLYPESQKPNKSREIYLAKLYYNADAIISIPVLKNHESAALTVGIKNTSIGMAPPSIYRKDLYNIPNLRFEIDHSYPNMHKWIHDFFMCRPTDFVVVDALQGLQYGPGGGGAASSNRMNMRLILAGRDLVSVDAIAAHLVGLDPRKINYLTYLHNDHAGCADHRLIRVNGNVRVSDVKKKFKHNDPRTIAVMVSDFTSPDMKIKTLQVQGEQLFLSLDVSEDTELLEVAIDGDRLDQVIVSDFENIYLPVTVVSGTPELELVAYDKYRNATCIKTTVTQVRGDRPQTITAFELYPNVPNPFNPTTTISYSVDKTGHVRLDVFNMRGQQVRTLVNQQQRAGTYSVPFNAGDLPSGTYLYRLTAGGRFMINKMALVR